MKNISKIIPLGKSPTVNKYLRKCEFRSQLEPEPNRYYRRALVIPACREQDFIFRTLASLAGNPADLLAATMTVVVINNPPPEDGLDSSAILENYAVYEQAGHPPPELSGLELFLVDAFSPGHEIPAEYGVGMARKIGMDLALPHLTDDAVIISLDADTIVENNYLSAIDDFFNEHHKAVAATIKFRHQAGENPQLESAIRSYEEYLGNYVEALRHTGSPYAYRVMGSAFACRAKDYVRAGGMKRKNGGEDFYFMQALRKIGSIGEINETCVYPSARISNRVPFGTGPQIAKLADGRKSQSFHDPHIFEMLKDFFSRVNTDPAGFKTEDLPKALQEFLKINNFNNQWPKIKNNTPQKPAKLIHAFHTWFDAFRILKFVHFCETRKN